MATKWLYNIKFLPSKYDDAQELFNNMGDEGWELVSIIHHTKAKTFLEYTQSDYFVFFKKPV